VNTLKPLLTVAVLAGIGYGVYVRINSGTDAPPAGVAAGWDAAPKVQLGETMGSSVGGSPWGGAGGSPVAPPFGPPRGAPVAQDSRGPEAPPFNGAAPAVGGNAPAFAAQGPGAPAMGRGAGAADQVPPLPNAGNPFAGGAPAEMAAPREAVPPAIAGGSEMPPAQSYAPPDPAGLASAAGGAIDAGLADRYRNAPAAGPPVAGAAANFAAVMETVKRELETGQMASALHQLSACYENPQLSPGEQQQLNQLLDQIAGTVVYSTQHLLEPPYEVQPGERLEDIGQRYNVPWRLLAKINGIDDPQSLRPGERLKMVRGPFSAIVSLDKRQMTLLLADGSYAGRFNIGIGNEHPPREGVFAVSDKVENPVYRGRDRAIAADDPNNPLGERWIGLGSELAIHGTNRPDSVGRTDLPGSISLSPRDVEDVYDILGVGSKVTIRR
jgi:hypothetical protein